MDREEQIRSKAKELGQKYFPDEANVWARSNVESVYVENACVEMAEWADQHPHWIPVEKTNNTINVFFRKEQDGWHTYTQYGIDLPTSTAIEFGEHIAKAVNLLNGKGVTNE